MAAQGNSGRQRESKGLRSLFVEDSYGASGGVEYQMTAKIWTSPSSCGAVYLKSNERKNQGFVGGS